MKAIANSESNNLSAEIDSYTYLTSLGIYNPRYIYSCRFVDTKLETHTNKNYGNDLFTILVHNMMTTQNIIESQLLQQNNKQQSDKNIHV